MIKRSGGRRQSGGRGFGDDEDEEPAPRRRDLPGYVQDVIEAAPDFESGRSDAILRAILNEAHFTPQIHAAEAFPYGITPAEVARMATQSMSVEHMAMRFQIPPAVMFDCLARFTQLRRAYELGTVGLIDLASAVVLDAVRADDFSAAKFVLERKGGWTPPPRDTQIVVNNALQVTVDGGHVHELKERQRQLLEAVAASDMPAADEQMPAAVPLIGETKK
jgi:hypothetical protein